MNDVLLVFIIKELLTLVHAEHTGRLEDCNQCNDFLERKSGVTLKNILNFDEDDSVSERLRFVENILEVVILKPAADATYYQSVIQLLLNNATDLQVSNAVENDFIPEEEPKFCYCGGGAGVYWGQGNKQTCTRCGKEVRRL